MLLRTFCALRDARRLRTVLFPSLPALAARRSCSMVAARTSLRPVPTSGFLPIYKAPGTLSADVCARWTARHRYARAVLLIADVSVIALCRVKRTLRRHGDYPSKLKVGHGGTLDYFAEGLPSGVSCPLLLTVLLQDCSSSASGRPPSA